MDQQRKNSDVATKRVASIFWREIREQPVKALFITLLVIVANTLSAVAPLFYKRFFDLLTAPNVTEAMFGAAFVALLSGLALHAVQWVLWRPAHFLNIRLETRAMSNLSLKAFSNLLRHSHSFFMDSFVGSLTRKVHRFASSFETIIDELMYSLFPILITSVSIFIVIFLRSRVVGVAVLVWALLMLYANYLAVKWKQKYEEERSEADSRMTGILSDGITNSGTIKLFSAFRYEEGLFGEAVERVRKLRVFTWDIDEVIRAVQGFLSVAIEVVVMLVAFKLYREGQLTIGDFVLFQTYLLTLTNQLWNFGNVLKHFYRSVADAKEMVEILDMPYGVQDAPGAGELRVTEGRIEFREVTFNFHETRTVLERFSLAVAPHEKVALVGASGAGKTTVIKLILRLYDVTDGTIEIDGQDISRVTQESLRDAIALVPQDPILFHRSLKDNIRYGRRDASDEEVYEAAKKAHCHEFIASLPEGYDTLVGERGVKLSGGERQRIAIARAILKNAPILILDEATSSLDSESEHLIQDALKTLMEGKTVVVIAHRLSTIIKMDRTIVMENGKVRASGTHQELLTKDDLYKRLWSIQAGGFLADED